MHNKYQNKNKESRLLVLGGGRYQMKLICAAEKRGIRTVISDYLIDAPAKSYASYPTMTDALDIEANIALAKKYGVSGVITSGTDQALNTMAQVANELNLPCYLSPESAHTCTHKNKMIHAVQSQDIPRPNSLHITSVDQARKIETDLNFPLVIKPSDAQGQRGISIVRNKEHLITALSNALNASRESVAIAEEFIEGPEITVSAWLKERKANILMITDRVTYNAPPALGICFQHIFPSLHASHLADKAKTLMESIGQAYSVSNGPLYVQMIVKDNELFFIEGSCRIGGGHECSLIPLVTGIDVTEHLIDLAMDGETANIEYDFDDENIQKHAVVNFMLAQPGVIEKQTSPLDLPQPPANLIESSFYNQPGYEQTPTINGLSRVGYFICTADNRENLLEQAQKIYNQHNIIDNDKNEMLFWPDSEFMNGR